MLDRNAAAWMHARHSSLFHIVYRADHETRASVAENGLVAGVPRHFWGRQWWPRPGHVYLATGAYLKRVRDWGCRDYPVDVYAVDSRVLTVSRINPDEDWFAADDWMGGDNMIGDRHACQVFRLPFPPTPWMWKWADYLKMRPLATYGEWADAVNLGDDAGQTIYSLRRGSVAYRGEVPPTALRLIHSTVTE